MAEPKLNSPCTGWKRDLPGPNEPIEEAPTLLWFEPTHLDDVFVEISRNVLAVRGLVIWLAGLMGLVTLGGVASLVWGLITDPDGTYGFIGFTFVIFMIFSIAGIGFWITCFAYCSDVSPPRDLPLRFNRARRKVYVHGFHWVWWNPFTRWYVTTASYDWDDLRAEQWKVRGATANGALIVKEGVSIAVVKPGTHEVIDRFELSSRAGNTSNVWAYVCAYMQHGCSGLNPSEVESRDVNDVPPYNLALRLAPKVEWPPTMDRESRTAP